MIIRAMTSLEKGEFTSWHYIRPECEKIHGDFNRFVTVGHQFENEHQHTGDNQANAYGH